MIDKWTRFLEAAQAMGTPHAASAAAIEPAKNPSSEPETIHRADHVPSTAANSQTADAGQPALTAVTRAASGDGGSHAGSTTDRHVFAGAGSTLTHAEQFEIHTTTTADHGAATGITVDADVHMVVLPDHAPAASSVAAESPVPVKVAVHAHWHAEIADINSPAPSLSGPGVVNYSSTVRITTAPAAIDAPHAVSAPDAPATSLASLDNGDHVTSSVPVSWAGVPARQVLAALGGSGTGVTGAGIKVGVLSDSFNDLGGAAADEANGALPSAASIQILKDLGSGGADEGRAMMQIVHDIAPSAGLAFYTAFDSEQDFANGILALAAAGCKVICDDVSYYDEPFFQNGIVAQAIQTVEAQGVTYIAAAGNDGNAAYQAAWTPISGSFDGVTLTNAESFGGSIVQTMTVAAGVPLLLEWNQAYGHATSDLELLVFHNGSLVATATNQSVGEPTNPWTAYQFTASGTYQIAIENLSGPNPGLIKEIAAGDGLTANISGANSGTVYGHAMTPGVISAGAVDSAVTPAFGYGALANEPFSSSGAGTELLFANNGTALSSPLVLNPVTVSGVDDIATTVSGGLHDFYGTSAASASLAGVAALILAANPSLTPAQVAEIMQDTALSMSNSAVAGAGLVQVNAAIAEAQSFITHVIEAVGSTKLVQVGLNDFLDSVSTGTGPELKFAGTVYAQGSLGGWTPIAAEAVGTGYEVAFKMQGQDLYTVWNTDSNGNYAGNLTKAVAGSDISLEMLETNFHQDLNGDGVIGAPSAVIESNGATSLVQVGSNFLLEPVGGSGGPTLKFGGTAFTPGSLGGWTPIAAETAGSGYEVAFKVQGQDLYTVWNTDGDGNYIGNVTKAVASSDASLEMLETSFHQDLNGDGVIGAPTVVIESDGATSLVQVANNFLLNPVGGGAGPTLKFSGTAFTPGRLGGWMPIAAEAAGTGYDVAFKMQGQDLYTVWNTDNNGNYAGNLTKAVAGSDVSLEMLETNFHQDLNGDGVIGAPSAVIESNGATSLVQVGSNFLLEPVGGSSGPTLKFGGTAFTPGSLGAWAPIAAEATGSGYEVVFKVQGQDLYTVWNTDSNGNYTGNATSAVSGSAAALEALEPTFQQDINGDGHIGVPNTTIETYGATSLVQIANTYDMDPVGGGTGPTLKYGGAPIIAGTMSGWTPIGAEAVGASYEVAFKMQGQDLYTVWNTDGNGNYTSNAVGAVSGHSAALEGLEPSFHQDLNGDGTTGIAPGASSVASIQSSPHASSDASFDGHLLTLASPATFGGHIVGFGTDGTGEIDLNGIAYTTLHTSFDSAADKLAVTDGTTSAQLQFVGSYTQDSFHFADDGHGGTLVATTATSSPPSGGQTDLFSGGPHDTFVLAPHFGQTSIANFNPVTDSIAFSKNVFASQDALAAAIHNDAAGNAVITDAAHDTITLQHVTATELLAHLTDFHIV